MKTLKHCVLLTFFVLVQGCTVNTQKSAPLSKDIYLDHHFIRESDIESPEQIFAINNEIRSYVKRRLTPLPSAKEKSKRLIKDLFSEQHFNIKYLHHANYTPIEAYENGLANCMTLTLLSYVIANEAGLNTKFMNVKVEENWNISNGRIQLNGHVNLDITPPSSAVVIYPFSSNYTIDFLPMLATKVRSREVLTKPEIIALFYNNKGAAALSEGNTNLAYQYFKQATTLAPRLSSVWGNLASLYRQSGFLNQAESIYLHAIELDRHNLNLKENLALLYKLTNRQDKSESLYREVREKRKSNPYYYAMLAEQALLNYDLAKAQKLFKKAIKLNRRDHSFFMGLAKVAMLENDFERAEHYLRKAKRLAILASEKRKYDNKITALSQLVAKAH